MNEKTCQCQFHHLSIGYDKHSLIQDLNLTIHNGDYIGIIGENGTGKSTLIQTLLGFIPAVSGKITWNTARKRIGYLPQQKAIQRDFPASVEEIVLSGLLAERRHTIRYRKEDKHKAMKAMEQIGITSLAKCCYGELSGGQQQKVLLARALCTPKDLLILDEPVTGLDIYAIQNFYQTIHEINRLLSTTILMVTHDIDKISKVSDYLLQFHLDGSYEYKQNRQEGGNLHEGIDQYIL
ncbi:zinc ABC transporter, ATP-binding protein ZnuC [Lachnospiraceae bacterium KM106-2]|nr:zinc ABC transporter, ATP-binding protein ZnuC [Lachnospiraceae bacterium KM106-2]